LFENDEFSSITDSFQKINFSFEQTAYTEFDLTALKLLYHDDLTVGMSFAEAEETIQKAIAQGFK